MTEKKLPLLGDVRDESAEEIRLVLEPKSRTVDPMLLMESLFRLTELEVRFGLNMNVLSAGPDPERAVLRDVLRQWLEHRVDVLVRRSQFRLKKIEHRLEVLDGYLVAYLNLDEVIRIVRYEDDPKARLIEEVQPHRGPGRGDPQPALESRCRSSRRSRSGPSTTSSRRSGAS